MANRIHLWDPYSLLAIRYSLLFQRMRHDLAHHGRKRLAGKVGNGNPTRAGRRTALRVDARDVNSELERKMREGVRHHSREAAPIRFPPLKPRAVCTSVRDR